MAAIKQSPVPPPPPLSFCEGPRILQNLRDVVFQIVELPLYILSFLAYTWEGGGMQWAGAEKNATHIKVFTLKIWVMLDDWDI
jgi:hypothetical protein